MKQLAMKTPICYYPQSLEEPSNLTVIEDYLEELKSFIGHTQLAMEQIDSGGSQWFVVKELKRLASESDIEFMLEDFAKALSGCKLGAKRIGVIVKNLKEFSHIDDGQLKKVDLNQCMDNVIQICWNEVKHKAELTNDYGELPQVSCNPLLIEQSFMILLINAVQAIESSGQVFITTWQEDENVLMSIRDTGKGTKKENLSKLFEPFYTTKPVGKGTGLGLHVVYQIVKAHGRKIDVKSEIGSGTEFMISLPVAQKASVIKADYSLR